MTACARCRQLSLHGRTGEPECSCVEHCGYLGCGADVCADCRADSHDDCAGDECGCWCRLEVTP